jgi:16S rRNA (cytidine1402-2'-O)-methyltransferase
MIPDSDSLTPGNAGDGGGRATSRGVGNLYIVATPLGNLGDITFRAIEVLRDVDVIATEDTRRTSKLLSHYEIKSRLVAYHEHNEARAARAIVERILGGESIALVTDAGTPLVSDPGFRLVAACVDADIDVVPLPGPSALVAALCASGLPPHPFYFAGFLPRRSAARKRRIAALSDLPCTLVFYESPHRVASSIRDMADELGDRPAVIARELTKIHEEFLRERLPVLAELVERRTLKGEIVIIVAGPDHGDTPSAGPDGDTATLFPEPP